MAATCGTGGWIGPQPGDPGTDDILVTATPAFGGIDVNWTYPNINPNAVAYTVIYRSLLPDPESATALVFAQGNFYYDKITNSNIVYYYWIKIYSIYGTPSALIGPAWANAKPLIEQMIEELTGKIDNGMLAESLKGDLDQITLNKLGITQEMLDRDANDNALGVRITEIGAYNGETRALVQEEVLARVTQGEAFVTTVNTLYSTLNGNIAGVQESVTAVVHDLDALASKVDQVEVQFGDDLAQVSQTMEVKYETITGTVTEIGALWNAKVTVNGLVGGFGVYNDGTTVEAGFDVDTFWIGRTNENKRKPFIVSEGTVYIDEAAINYLTFTKLRSEDGSLIFENGKLKADYIAVDQLVVHQAQSDNYVAGQTGWILNRDGSLEFNGAVAGGGRLTMTNKILQVFDSNNRLRVRLGMWT